jgi:hypothetical protein
MMAQPVRVGKSMLGAEVSDLPVPQSSPALELLHRPDAERVVRKSVRCWVAESTDSIPPHGPRAALGPELC